jgi:hypothetical protein
MKILFNRNISEVRVYEKALHYSELVVSTGKIRVGRKFGIIPIYEKIHGLFWWIDGEYWGTIEDYNKRETSYVEGDTFFKRPHCEIWLNNGEHHEQYFKTVDELYKYVEELKSSAPHITLTTTTETDE